MRLMILVFAIVSAVASSAQAQSASGFVELWNNVSATDVTPQVNVYAKGPIKGKLGWTVWTLNSKEWSEGLAGLTFAPAKWVEVSASLGIEADDNPLRTGASIWVGRGRWSLLSIHEHGGSGYWYRYLGTFQATKTVSVGINSVKFLGTGPYVSKTFGKVALWGTYAITDDKGVVGVRFNF